MDYRNAIHCPPLNEVAKQKGELGQKIRDAHPRRKIIYNSINNKQSEYFKEFAKIYNFKCAYCGASVKFTDVRLFEIDHYICESAFPNDTKGRAEAGKIENLIFSCYSCNRGKGKLHIKGDYAFLLNPDENSIANAFFRTPDYYIHVQEEHTSDEFVKLFYKELTLGSEFRRLDFLLLEMDQLITQLRTSNKDLANKLELCLGRLMQKKNVAFM